MSDSDPKSTPDVADTTRWRELELEAVRRGTTNQQERYAADMLPEDELAFLAREELFAKFESFGLKRYSSAVKLKPHDLRHAKDCHGDVVFEVTKTGELLHDEWRAYRVFQECRDQVALHPWLARGGTVVLEPLSHWATCSVCEREACKQTIKVTITWAGRILVREYALLGAP